MLPVVVLLVAMDAMALSSSTPGGHRVGLVVSRERRPCGGEADLEGLKHIPAAGACVLDDGTVAVWHSPRWLHELMLPLNLRLDQRVFGINAVSALVRQDGAEWVVERRLRWSLLVLIGWLASVGVWGAAIEGSWAIGAIPALIACVVLGSAVHSYSEVRSYVALACSG